MDAWVAALVAFYNTCDNVDVKRINYKTICMKYKASTIVQQRLEKNL